MTKKICIFTDAAEPQTNGVVVTLKNIVQECHARGCEMTVISPNSFQRTYPLPWYPEIRLAFPSSAATSQFLKTTRPDRIHIATEGPIGQSAARACRELGMQYTSSYHTQFPEYVNGRAPFIPKSWIYRWVRRVHDESSQVLVTTDSMAHHLIEKGFDRNRLTVWGRGVDRDVFRPGPVRRQGEPITLLNVGRVSPEKNLEAFLDLPFDHRVHKRVVGDGPSLARLRRKYRHNPCIVFVGKKTGEALAQEYQAADVFVFPSLTDTFGLVQIESIACGTPVAAYPVTGPIDVIEPGVTGAMSWDLRKAIEACTRIDRAACARASSRFTWESATDTFINSLVPTGG